MPILLQFYKRHWAHDIEGKRFYEFRSFISVDNLKDGRPVFMFNIAQSKHDFLASVMTLESNSKIMLGTLFPE